MSDKEHRRFERQFSLLQNKLPKGFRGWIIWLRKPYARLLRIPLGLLLILGGVFSILPILGLWMMPFGLLLLAVDLPILQGPLADSIVRLRRWWENFRRSKR